MAEIEKVKLPNDDTIYDIKDAKAIRGLASGTTSGHVLQFGADGYTVSDSGKSMSDKQDTIDSSHKLSADLVDNSTPTFATATQGGKADTAVQTIKVNSASTGVTKTGDTVDITAIPASIVSAGALVNGMTTTTQSTSDDSTKLATTAFVHDVVDELPEPMIFKSGMTLTADSTDTTKCAITVTDPVNASDIKGGYTYKVTNISGTYTGTIKVGDTLIAKKDAPKVDKTWVVDTDWTVVPSGDETGYVVGKSSGTTQNNLVKWGADGYTIDDSGITVETSFSGTSDAKVPTSKSIKTNVADNAVLTGFTPVVTPSAIQNVASTDTITDAMEKLDNNTRLNQSNILTVADQSTQYNYSSISSMSGTSGFTSTFYFDKPIPTGTYRIICNNVRTDTSKQCQFQVVGANATTQYTNLAPTISTAAYTSNEFTTTFDLYGIKVYCNTPIEITNIAIIPKALYDKGFTTYQPYSIPPSELTANITAVNTMIYTVQQANTITLQLKNARTYIVYGFMQGIGNVFWTLELLNGYTLKSAYNGTTVTLPTGIEASFDTTTNVLTITSTFSGNNTLTILGTSI